MQIERAKNATRNILYGVILSIFQILSPFFMRTAMIYFMGIQYLGLNSLFSSVLQVLNLAELGVGSAMVFSMYKPIVEDDTRTICALLKLYRTYYRIIGLVIAVAGLIFLPFIPKLIKGSIPQNLNVYILYILNLGATVLSYWLFAYKNSLLTAFQRNDLISKVTLLTTMAQYGLQLAILIFVKNYYWYLIVALLTQASSNIMTAAVTTKHYPNYRPVGSLDKKFVHSINHRIRDLFTAKLGGVIVNSVDSIVISAFLGLTALAVYQNYFYILTAIFSLVSVIFSSCMAGIGNSIIVETVEKNYSDFNKLTFVIGWISGFCASCLLCLFQPFMKIWVGEKYELAFSAVVCFCVYYFVYEINQLLNMYKDAAGIWHKDRFRPLITAGSNLVMNLIMVQFWGIYGVILSTVLSTLLIGMPWLLHNLFTILFPQKYLLVYLKKLLFYFCTTILAASMTYFCCSWIHFTPWLDVFIKAIICAFIPNIIFFLIYRKMKVFQESLLFIDGITRERLHLKRLYRERLN